MSDKLVPVPIGPCRCSGTPHEGGDVVYLRPKLGLGRAMAVINGAAGDFGDEEAVAFALTAGYPRYGIADWNLTNGDGKKQPIDGEHLLRFTNEDPRAMQVAIRGNELYSEEVTGPLVALAQTSSPATSTNGSTSVSNGTEPSTKRPRRSKPSSITTIPMDDTATTSA